MLDSSDGAYLLEAVVFCGVFCSPSETGGKIFVELGYSYTQITALFLFF